MLAAKESVEMNVSDRQPLDLNRAREHAVAEYKQPVLLLEERLLREAAQRFMAAMPRVTPHFAVKCNPVPEVLSIFKQEGVGFEIASKKELQLLLDQGVPGSEVFYSNPIKSNEHLQFAIDNGVEWYVIDSADELRKVHALKPDAKFYLRLYTSNEGSVWELSSKFGASQEDATNIMHAAVKLQADLAGVTFHAGSQCLNIDNWLIGIRAARKTFDEMLELGFKPRLLNLGGGYPMSLGEPAPTIEEIGAAIDKELKVFPDDVKIIAEPGRYLVSGAGSFVCRVIGTASRGEKRWLYLDAGYYGGLDEVGVMPYVIHTERSGKQREWHLAGPTCDSIDMFKKTHYLPEDLQADDFVYVESAGAYTNATACEFNGFSIPEVKVI